MRKKYFLDVNPNCKKAERMVVSKRDSLMHELFIGVVKIKQVEQFNYLGSVTIYGKSDIEIRIE